MLFSPEIKILLPMKHTEKPDLIQWIWYIHEVDYNIS